MNAAPNPFLEKWTTPFEAPPFDRIKPEHFAPAFEQGMAAHKADIAKITANKEKPTFDNTIAALDRSGNLLEQSATVFFNVVGAEGTDAMQKIELEWSPKLTRHANEILQNAALFARVKTVYDARETSNLTPEQKRVTERAYARFVRAGAALAPTQRQRMASIDEKLSSLGSKFEQNLLADTRAFILTLETEEDMAGLPDFVREAARAEAKSRGMEKTGVVTISRSSYEPFMKFSTRRDLRERLFRAWTLRGDNGNEFDNKAILAEMISLRTERAKLLGYPTYAHFALDDVMAKKPENAMDLMLRVWKPARAQALRDVEALQKMMPAGQKLEAWDWLLYEEKVRKAKYDLDETQMKPYFQLDKMLEAVFWSAGRMHGLTFHERKDLPTWHPDVRVWEVKNSAGKHVALFYGDYFARPTKRGGAWMNSYRDQERLRGNRTPIVANHCNFNKAAPGQPVLLSYSDAETLFHEFGHALHGMLSNVTYPSVSGTAVPRDFVEFPSQVNEHWLGTDAILNKFALHYQTGKPLPKDLLEKMRAAEKFGQGFATVEFLASALVDMELHLVRDNKLIDAAKFEKEALAKIGMPPAITMRHRSPHFSHIFGGGYAAGYYGYLWAEVFDADAFAAFEEKGDPYDPELSRKFRENILSVGNSRDLLEAYRQFRGKDASVEPLLEKRGFNTTPQ